MPRKTWTLTDVDEDIYVEQISLGPEQVGGPAKGYSRDQADPPRRTARRGRRGRGRQRAVPLRRRADPRHGHLAGDCGDVQLGWKSPVKGPVHPAFVPLWEPSGIGWLERLRRVAGPLRPGEQRGAGVPAQRRAPLPAARQDRQHAGPQGRR